jgi:hypothetical protein
MNELVRKENVEKLFPTIKEGLKRAKNGFDSINSFEDIENVFLKLTSPQTLYHFQS